MKTKAAVLYEVGQPLVLEEVELDDPREGGGADKGGSGRYLPQ